MEKKFLYKIEYVWYEGETDWFYVATDMEEEDFDRYLETKINEVNNIEIEYKMTPTFYSKLKELISKDEEPIVINWLYDNLHYYVEDKTIYDENKMDNTICYIDKRKEKIQSTKIGDTNGI